MLLEQIDRVGEALIEALAGLGVVAAGIRKFFLGQRLKEIDRKLDRILEQQTETHEKVAVMRADVDNLHERVQRVEYGSYRGNGY